MKRLVIGVLTLCLLAGCRANETEPTPSRHRGGEEWRCVWVTYYELEEMLADTTPKQAEQAIIDLLEQCEAYRINTVFFHLRGNSDAYYPSQVYPPAAGVKSLLEAGFDPLAVAVREAHRRGMALHAWINPYRVGKAGIKGLPTFAYEGTTYYAPHDEQVQSTVAAGVAEIVEGYDVDGVQFDDYFYPVGALPADQPADFEKEDFAAYQKENPTATVGDFRRAGVDALIRQVRNITKRRAGCLFGVSPAADADRVREQMYADITGWMANSGVDYVCPQLYFGFDHETYPFSAILQKWLGYDRADGVALVVGLPLYKAGQPDEYAGEGQEEFTTHDRVISRQVNYLRTRRGVDGFALFRFGSLTSQNDIARRELAALQQVV